MKSAILASLVAGASATVYFKESFDSCKFFFGYKDQKIRRHVFKKRGATFTEVRRLTH